MDSPYAQEEDGFAFAFADKDLAIEEFISVIAPNAVCEWSEKDDSWKEAYEKSFDPVGAGDFCVRASWKKPIEGKIDLIIDPETVFGTGRHETTACALELISELDLSGSNVLDVGCGSGVLAIAAAKKGARISLCDTDERAIESAERNCALNGAKIKKIWVGSVDKVTEHYDLIMANIVADVLIALKNDLRRALKSGATLIVSGVLDRYKERFKERYGDLETLRVVRRGEWLTFAFKN
ncbi:MAG: 50S ribosomal protein L11 methyltransferase [Helicobacteraceae bacterium]|nr:50S ribosomal protein L11 methyltransferase [Helicobacteraceae bacterium]